MFLLAHVGNDKHEKKNVSAIVSLFYLVFYHWQKRFEAPSMDLISRTLLSLSTYIPSSLRYADPGWGKKEPETSCAAEHPPVTPSSRSNMKRAPPLHIPLTLAVVGDGTGDPVDKIMRVSERFSHMSDSGQVWGSSDRSEKWEV